MKQITSPALTPRLLVTVVVLAAVGACANEQPGLGDPTGSTCPESSTLTYENFGQAFMTANCTSCHERGRSPSLSTQADVQDAIDLIDRAAASGPDTTNTYMPQDGDIAESERKKLGEWLACGAP